MNKYDIVIVKEQDFIKGSDKQLLVNAIIGCGSIGTFREESGLIEFCGNQWNLDFKWKRKALEKLSIDDLACIYNSLVGGV